MHLMVLLEVDGLDGEKETNDVVQIHKDMQLIQELNLMVVLVIMLKVILVMLETMMVGLDSITQVEDGMEEENLVEEEIMT